MSIIVEKYNEEKVNEIEEAINSNWNLNDFSVYNNELYAVGENNLCGGESEEEFANRMSKAIWEANDAYCEININATYLEDLPYESYNFDEEEYKEYITEKGE